MLKILLMLLLTSPVFASHEDLVDLCIEYTTSYRDSLRLVGDVDRDSVKHHMSVMLPEGNYEDRSLEDLVKCVYNFRKETGLHNGPDHLSAHDMILFLLMDYRDPPLMREHSYYEQGF